MFDRRMATLGLRLAAAVGLSASMIGCDGNFAIPGATGLGTMGGLQITKLNITPSTVAVGRGQSLALSVETSNPLGGNLFYSWTASGGSLSASNTNPVRWTAPSSPGRATVQVYVQNGNEVAKAEFGFNVQ